MDDMTELTVPGVGGAPRTVQDAWIERVRIDPRVSHGGFRLAHALASLANSGGGVQMAMKDLAYHAGLSTPGTSASLDRLAACMFIDLERRGGGKHVRIWLNRDGVYKRRLELKAG